MLKQLNWGILFTCCLFSSNAPIFAANSTDSNEEYFKALDLIKKPTQGSIPVLPCDVNEKKNFISLLKQNDIKDFEDLTLSDEGQIADKWEQQIELYKGDFSNEGITEYAVVSTGGTMHASQVSVYKLIDNRLSNTNLDQIIISNLIPKSDMSAFYLNTAAPFAVTNDGKTYLRYMSYPEGKASYDKTQLELCTYLWQGKKFSLSGPNWTFAKPKGNLTAAKGCISN